MRAWCLVVRVVTMATRVGLRQVMERLLWPAAEHNKKAAVPDRRRKWLKNLLRTCTVAFTVLVALVRMRGVVPGDKRRVPLSGVPAMVDARLESLVQRRICMACVHCSDVS